MSTRQHGGAEPLLLSVRSQVGAALDALDEETSAASPNVFARVINAAFPAIAKPQRDPEAFREKMRQDLEAIGKAAQDAEQACGQSRKIDAGRFNHVDDERTRVWLNTAFTSAAQENGEQEHEGKEMYMTATKSFASKDASLKEALADESIAELLDKAGEFDFDALTFSKHAVAGIKPISILGVHLEMQNKLIERMHSKGNLAGDMKPFQTAFLAFLGRLDMLYKPDAIYHGLAHAVDVMSTVMWFLKSSTLEANSKPIDRFTIMMAAAIHDVGHPGVNNLFLTKTMDPLALRYNDKSVLENMHVALAFETMVANSEANWFKLLDATVQKQVRSSLIGMVLATDMATHANMDKAIEAFHLDDDQLDFKFLFETVVHCADITNPAKPRAHMLGWTKRITEEFWTQGDREQQLGLDISPMCERASGMISVPKGQIGFINFVVMPYCNHIKSVIPELERATDGLRETTTFWEKAIEDDLTYEQIFTGSV